MKKAKSYDSTAKRLNYFKRHIFNFLPHLTPQKILNLILNETERRLVVTAPMSNPPYVKIDPTSLCNLRCPCCEHLQKRQLSRENLTLANLKKIVDPIGNTLLGISLSFTGEPLMNRELISMIEYIHGKNIAVSFPTNFSLPISDENMKHLAKSGLDSIMISLDGTSQESYSRYRVGGDIGLVTDNVRRLSDVKKQLRRARPRIIWKFIIFDHNRHETGIVRDTYKSLGFNGYAFVNNSRGSLVTHQKIERKKKMFEAKEPCHWLWNTIFFGTSGSVQPCCWSWDFKLGNAFEEDIRVIWRNKSYVDLRKGFAKKNYGQKLHKICERCMGVWEGKQRWR